MTTRNDITGDNIASKQNSNKFRDGWDAIWSKKDTKKKEETKKEK